MTLLAESKTIDLNDLFDYVPGPEFPNNEKSSFAFLVIKGTSSAIMVHEGGDVFQDSEFFLVLGEKRFQLWDDFFSLISIRKGIKETLKKRGVDTILYRLPREEKLEGFSCFDIFEFFERVGSLPENLGLIRHNLIKNMVEEEV